MKLNIFRVDADELPGMLARFEDVGLELVSDKTEASNWQRRLFYSTDPGTTTPGWVLPLTDDLPDGVATDATYLFAALLVSRADRHFLISYGKSHFYIRPYADYDFGMNLGKRIANHNETKHIAAKRDQGNRRKDIKSFGPGSRLDPESGESVDYLELAIADEVRDDFGKSGRFGTSAQLTVPKLTLDDLGNVLDKIEVTLTRDELFKVPRTTLITDDEEKSVCQAKLIEELRKPVSDASLALMASESFDLWGVDFMFPSSYFSYELRGPGHLSRTQETLTIRDLKQYIIDHNVSDDRITRIKVVFNRDEGSPYRKNLLEVLDYVGGRDLILNQGKWMRFNQDYLDALDDYLDGIEAEMTEPDFKTIDGKEGDFNASDAIAEAGYTNTDKNFAILRTRARTPVEAHDLRRGDTIYAVKFGTAQKLGYACDQASEVMEILRNVAATTKPEPFKRFCLWFGYRSTKPLERISQTQSIILKQKIELWARRTREMGCTPVIKLSHHTGPSGMEGAGSDQT